MTEPAEPDGPRPAFRSDEARAEPFGYVCGQCSNCCRDKRIQVNPYELARLARAAGVSAREFRQRHTEDGAGTHLARYESGACVFLGERGCTVHGDRPLVCRLYPLGRRITAEGGETFSHWEPHVRSAGRYHRDGTIADYLAAQGAAEFMRAADDYFWWFVRARLVLLAMDGAGTSSAQDDGSILDLDAAIERHCQRTGEPEPADIEPRRTLHLRIMDEWLAGSREAR